MMRAFACMRLYTGACEYMHVRERERERERDVLHICLYDICIITESYLYSMRVVYMCFYHIYIYIYIYIYIIYHAPFVRISASMYNLCTHICT